MSHQIQPISDKFYQCAIELEQEWEKSQTRFSCKELLVIFPEAKPVIPDILQEWQNTRNEIVTSIKKKLAVIKHWGTDESTKFFWREWIKLNDGKKLIEADIHISRLKQLLYLIRGRPPSKNWISEDQIQTALAVPLESLLNQKLKRSGNVLIGLCPLHNEKHPSFCIYTKTNTCWCYGCNKGGNTITFVRLLNDCSFRKAIAYLLGQ